MENATRLMGVTSCVGELKSEIKIECTLRGAQKLIIDPFRHLRHVGGWNVAPLQPVLRGKWNHSLIRLASNSEFPFKIAGER